MGAEIGNQYAVGNKGGGRKGYEYEQEQINKMGKILNGVLGLADKIQNGKATAEDYKKFQILMKLNLKIMDKLHSTKQTTDMNVSTPDSLIGLILYGLNNERKNTGLPEGSAE